MDEQHRYEGPQPEAYGRITYPERYLVVHEAAAGLMDVLEETFVVRRSEPDPAPDLVTRCRAFRAIRLDPEDPDAGTLLCTFTSFPGVILALGGGFEQPFPWCGCDACDEAPENVVRDLVRTTELFVQGGLVEGFKGNKYSCRIGGHSGTTVLADEDPRRRLPKRRSWKAWTKR